MTDHYDDRHHGAVASAQDMDFVLEEYKRRQMLEHLTGPIVSMAVHVILLMLCFVLFQPQTPQAPKDNADITMIDVTPTSIKPPPIPPVDEPIPPAPIDHSLVNNMPPPIDTGTPDGDPVAAVPGGGVDTGSNEDNNLGNNGGESNDPMETIVANIGPVVMTGLTPGADVGNRNVRKRGDAIKQYLGDKNGEVAVVRALGWLKANQNDDGSWSKTMPCAMTGLALLAYLAHDETPANSPAFGITVQKALEYLSTRMEAAPGILERDYSHGIATYALCEAYGLTKVPATKVAATKGLRIIVEGQQAKGGWNYNFAKDGRWDLSVSGWQIQAVRAGFLAGIEVPGLAESMEKSADFLRQVCFRNGKFGYASPGSGSDAMQGAGTLCLQMLGYAETPEVRAGVKYISKNVEVQWRDPARGEVAMHNHPCYGWYYQTQAMFHTFNTSPETWRKWNTMFSEQVKRSQQPDGHWDAPPAAGKQANLPEYDPYYSTTLCCLMLEVYYRNLPTFKPPKPVATQTAFDKAGIGLDL